MDIDVDLVEIILAKPDDFLKVKETLTRIGIPDHTGKTLSQSCHILHKRGKYYIVHFLQMFILDGKRSVFSDEDRARLNYIISLLVKWNLVTLAHPEQIASPVLLGGSNIRIIPYREKSSWTLVPKYSIGI